MAEMPEVSRDPRKYVRIADDLRGKLDAGVIPPGNTVPIVPLSRQWGTSRQTVARALRVLEAEGLIKRYPGFGYCVLPRP
jgi:GntR family transcriptional regulator